MTCDLSPQLIFPWAGDSGGTLGLSLVAAVNLRVARICPASPCLSSAAGGRGFFKAPGAPHLQTPHGSKGGWAPGLQAGQRGRFMGSCRLARSLSFSVSVSVSLSILQWSPREVIMPVWTQGGPGSMCRPTGKPGRAASGERGHHGQEGTGLRVGGADVAVPPLGRPSALPSCAVCFSTAALPNGGCGSPLDRGPWGTERSSHLPHASQSVSARISPTHSHPGS